MRTPQNFYLTAVILCLASAMQAQPVAPTANIPVVEPAQPNPSFLYLGLEDITGQNKFNYIQTQIPDQPIQTWPTVINSTRYRQVTDYFDGLGRPLQSVNMRGHQDGYDIVKHNVYDALGKTKYNYLPFAVPASMVPTQNGKIKLDANTKLRAFYDQAAPDEPPYSVSIDDDSPLGRIIKTMAPGIAWVGNNRGRTNYYRTNNAIEEVRVWTIGDANTDFPKSDFYFATDQLAVTETTDEDGKKQRTYTDKFGRVVLTKSLLTASPGAGHAGFTCTYYVYDKAGRLRFMIPPKAVEIMNSAGGTWQASSVPELLFSYFYDKKGRVVEKKIPGKAVEEYVYDERDRLVYSRDGNQKQNGQWAFTIYDAQNRPVVTGIGAFTSPRDVLQGLVDDPAYQYPPPSIWAYIKNYNLYNIYPTQIDGATPLAYTYYDNYDNSGGLSYQYNRFNNQLPPTSRPELTPVTQNASTMTRGLVTGNKIAMLDPENNQVNSWLNTANFYDENGRLIQTIKENLNGGKEITSNIYYFQGMLWRTIRHHENPKAESIPGANDGPITAFDVVKTYERNIGLAGGNDAVKKITQSINGGPQYNLVDFNYDHLGRNTTKSLNVGVVLNEYNMRGFLNHINAEDRTAYPFKPIFEEKLYYDTGFASKLFNGNIAGIIWNGSDGEKRSYGYSYDLINRLTHAEFRFKAGTWKNSSKDYTASNIKYDLNGNLTAMIQKGWDPATSSVINMDKLTYTYSSATNRLIKVQDDGVASSLPDFKDDANLSTEYFYDQNGNMISDLNKKISGIKYNHLNKPIQINVTGKGKINYFYDASGTLLRKEISGDSTATYDYFGEFVYKNKVLQYIVNEEGRARPIANDTSNFQTRFVYDYFIKDHLGNVRSTVTAAPISRDYLARHEIATANSEQIVFDNIPSVRDGKPISTNPEDLKAAHLVAEDPDRRIGTAIMLKVMPGDKFTINAESFYEGEPKKDNPTVSGADLIASLMGALMGGSTYTGIPIAELPDNLATVKRILSNPELITVLDQVPVINENPNAPKAHLNYMFFDDNMQLVPGLSGRFQVPVSNGSGWQAVDPGNICNCTPVGPGTSGWVVIYVDNQTIGKDVWFDNIHIEHYNSKVLEENHYYPHGLTLNTMTTGQSNLPGQPYKYNGKELEKTYGLEMYDYGARMYDPQLGIWHVPDPMAPKVAYESPFVYAGNNPVRNIDFGGLYKVEAADLNRYLAKYPKIMGYLANQVESDISRSSKITNALHSINPNLDPSTITGITKWGKGPTIEFVDELGSVVKSKNAAGYTFPDMPNIQLNSKYAEYVEDVLNGDASSEFKLVTFTRFFMTLIHETAHQINKTGKIAGRQGDGHYLYMRVQNDQNFKGEPGSKVEEEIWGTENYKPSTGSPEGAGTPGLLNIKSEKYRDGVTEDVVDHANRTEEGKKTLPTVPRR